MKEIQTVILLLILSTTAHSAGYSNWAIPEKVELISGGVLIHGDFGNPNTCAYPNYIFISQSESKYDSALSMSLSALMGQREMRFYSNTCVKVSFHWAEENAINQNAGQQAVFIK
ncbi:MAG: hypothetical protein GY820_02270 [Gammaproteobacteria bacterium]|nr:hypothetical protein [Gammaproteobacteria bacterium]